MGTGVLADAVFVVFGAVSSDLVGWLGESADCVWQVVLPYVALHGYAGLRAVVSDDDFGHVYDFALVGVVVVVSFYRWVGDPLGHDVAVGAMLKLKL